MKLRHPDTGDVIDVPEDAAPVYAKAGWTTKLADEPEKPARKRNQSS